MLRLQAKPLVMPLSDTCRFILTACWDGWVFHVIIHEAVEKYKEYSYIFQPLNEFLFNTQMN